MQVSDGTTGSSYRNLYTDAELPKNFFVNSFDA